MIYKIRSCYFVIVSCYFNLLSRNFKMLLCNFILQSRKNVTKYFSYLNLLRFRSKYSKHLNFSRKENLDTLPEVICLKLAHRYRSGVTRIFKEYFTIFLKYIYEFEFYILQYVCEVESRGGS